MCSLHVLWDLNLLTSDCALWDRVIPNKGDAQQKQGGDEVSTFESLLIGDSELGGDSSAERGEAGANWSRAGCLEISPL